VQEDLGDRALFETRATSFYEEVVNEGGLAADDPRVAEGGEQHEPFVMLRDLGLLRWDPSTSRYLPEDPSSVQGQVVAPLSQQGARLLEESSQWARAFGVISQSWRRSTLAQTGGPFSYLRDEAIDRFLSGAVLEATQEVLTAQPQSGRNAPSVASAILRDTAMLERGVSLRTLYQHSARRSTFTQDYVNAVSALGARVRTLDEFFSRLIIIDREVAVIPVNDDHRSALAVREPSVLEFLVDIFERSWERARPFSRRDRTTMHGIAAEQRAMTIRMLVEGHSDPVSAKRLGVSPRTYAGYVADLKAELDVSTRFQLGYAVGVRGISGEEPIAPVEDLDEGDGT